MNENEKLTALINLAIYDDTRREMYLEALPKLTAEERLKMAVSLWELAMQKMHQLAMDKMETMVTEMAADGSKVSYEKSDFKAVYDEVINTFIAERLGMQDEENITKLREELNFIGQKVQEHDDIISKLKDKI